MGLEGDPLGVIEAHVLREAEVHNQRGLKGTLALIGDLFLVC